MNSTINHKKKISSSLGPKSSFKLTRSKKATTYKLPYANQVPAGDYISRVVSAKETTTKSGNDAIEVCYEIKDAAICEKILDGKLPSNANIPTHNIRQVYPLGTSFFDSYCEAMSEAAGSDEVMLDDTIGITERITLDYGNANIGGYVERHPLNPSEYDRVFRKSKPSKADLLDDSNDFEDEYDDFLEEDEE